MSMFFPQQFSYITQSELDTKTIRRGKERIEETRDKGGSFQGQGWCIPPSLPPSHYSPALVTVHYPDHHSPHPSSASCYPTPHFLTPPSLLHCHKPQLLSHVLIQKRCIFCWLLGLVETIKEAWLSLTPASLSHRSPAATANNSDAWLQARQSAFGKLKVVRYITEHKTKW